MGTAIVQTGQNARMGKFDLGGAPRSQQKSALGFQMLLDLDKMSRLGSTIPVSKFSSEIGIRRGRSRSTRLSLTLAQMLLINLGGSFCLIINNFNSLF